MQGYEKRYIVGWLVHSFVDCFEGVNCTRQHTPLLGNILKIFVFTVIQSCYTVYQLMLNFMQNTQRKPMLNNPYSIKHYSQKLRRVRIMVEIALQYPVLQHRGIVLHGKRSIIWLTHQPPTHSDTNLSDATGIINLFKRSSRVRLSS